MLAMKSLLGPSLYIQNSVFKCFGWADLLSAGFVVTALSLVEIDFLEAAVNLHLLQIHFHLVMNYLLFFSDSYCSRSWWLLPRKSDKVSPEGLPSGGSFLSPAWWWLLPRKGQHLMATLNRPAITIWYGLICFSSLSTASGEESTPLRDCLFGVRTISMIFRPSLWYWLGYYTRDPTWPRGLQRPRRSRG